MNGEYSPPTGVSGKSSVATAVGHKLRSARAELAATEDFVAAALGLTVEIYRSIEDGHAALSPGRVIQAAQLFGWPPSMLCEDIAGQSAADDSALSGPAQIISLAAARARRSG